MKILNPRKSKLLLFVTTVLLCVVGCSTTERVEPINQSLQLSEQQIKVFGTQAQNGDGDAAFRLCLCYLIVKLDRSSALKWAAMSATSGNTSAQYAMGMFYSGDIYPDLKDPDKSRAWFEKAASNGDTNALLRLQELKTK